MMELYRCQGCSAERWVDYEKIFAYAQDGYACPECPNGVMQPTQQYRNSEGTSP